MYAVYGIQLSDFHPSATLPQALGSIWGYAQLDEKVRENYELKKVFWENQSVDEVVDAIVAPDVLVCSCYVWNWDRTYGIMKAIKRDFPDCLVVIGGPQPEYSLQWMQRHPEIDVLVPYYGEAVFKNILLENLGSRNFDSLAGVLTPRTHNKNYHYPNFDEIPSPYLNGFFDRLIAEKRPSTFYVRCVFESNRGCPYSCSFCDIGSSAYQKIKAFDFERCARELEWIVKNDIAVVDVADANFGFLPRDEELVDILVDLKARYQWNGKFLPTWSKAKGDRVLRIAKKVIKGGLDSIFGLSLQSLNESTLKNIKRRNAFDLNDLSNIVAEMNKDGVSVYTELIFPLPGDTLENFKEGIYRMFDMENVFNKFQINQLSRYSNTEMNTPGYDELYGIDWVEIKGLTRHYYGDNASDFIAVGNKMISREDTFEALFFSKCYVIPVYFYGIIRQFADELHATKLMKRRELIGDLYQKLLTQDWFIAFRDQQKEHYFSALEKGTHFGQNLTADKVDFFPEFAIAHQFYLRNEIYHYLKFWYPSYRELVEFDQNSQWNNAPESKRVEFTNFKRGKWIFADERMMGQEKFLKEIYVSGRFDDRWRKKQIARI